MFAVFHCIKGIPKRTRSSSLVRTLSTSANSRTKSIRFYRLLLRQCNELDSISNEHRFLLRPHIIQQHEGLSSLSQNQEATADDVLHEFRRREVKSKPRKFAVRVIKVDSHDAISTEKDAPMGNSDSGDDSPAEADEEKDSDEEIILSLPTTPTSSFTPSLWCRSLPTVQETIREGFRQPPSSTTSTDQLFPVYQYLAHQHRLWNRTSVSIQHNIRITAVAAPLPRTITSTSRLDRFGYRIRVENLHATETVQLLGRSWIITCAQRPSTAPICVEAPTGGCVGQLPMIEPGYAFEYQSAAEVDQRGSMEGELFFLCKERGKFTVPVKTFELLLDV